MPCFQLAIPETSESVVQARQWAQIYFWISPITLWGYGIAMAASAGFNGLSRPRPALIMTVMRSLVFMAPAAWIGGSMLNGPVGAFWGLAAANVLSGALVAWWTLAPERSQIHASGAAQTG